MFEIGEEEFALAFFKEEGFTRRKCPRCGSHFWSKAAAQETCGEAPCQPYTFIGKPPTKRGYDVRDMRIQFLDFFAERGHTRIKPYPIVARWRNDVYLVGASIYDFQPYVTEGVMPPPANPLVISQPCIRFTDIEQVGPRAGRHMTIFEMGAHHAFNYPDHEVYWKEQTVRYHHGLLVDVLGVSSDAVTYKEHFWSGGGNAGPDLEGIVGGMEISTLVFMKYKVDGEQLVPTQIRTVDTGYGIERWSWVSQGSPSGFHAVYGPVLKSVFDLARVDVDESTVSALTSASGIFYSDHEPWRSRAIDWTAKETGQDPVKVQEALSTLEAAYGLTDHSKAFCFLLAEGVVPSNVGEGYLARLIIRRAARLARQLGILDMLPEIAEAQIKHWGVDFRTLRNMRKEVLEGLRVETAKYKDTISRGSEAVIRLSKELSDRGMRKIPTDKLVELYDSQGIPPEIVREGAEKVGVEVEIPENFIAMVAERHSKPEPEQGLTAADNLEQMLRELPPTRPLYYEDQYRTSFGSKVVSKVTDKAVVLDQTCFYPQGGGQPGDQGTLRFGETEARVVDVQKFGGSIVHFLDRPVTSEVDMAEGEIDWSRRQDLMRHHTATHALLGAARRVLGEHVWQAGAQKDVETSRLDITHYRDVTDREKWRIERLVNQVILRNVPVQANWLAREKAEARYGFRLYQGGAVPGAKIRVVTIRGWDAEACGGTHCKRTGELGVFRIEKIDRLQDGVERIIFSAGEPALKHINDQHVALAKASRLLGTTPEQLPEVVSSLLDERDRLVKESKKLREKMVESQVKQLARKARTIGPVQMVLAKVAARREYEIVDLADRLKVSSPTIVIVLFQVSSRVQVVAAAGDHATRAGINAAEVVSEVSRILGGGGGGRPFFATGGGVQKQNVKAAMDKAEEVVARQVGAVAGERIT